MIPAKVRVIYFSSSPEADRGWSGVGWDRAGGGKWAGWDRIEMGFGCGFELELGWNLDWDGIWIGIGLGVGILVGNGIRIGMGLRILPT